MKPNVIFILVDSMRADKCFNNITIETPNIELLTKKGLYFENAFSSSDYTITGYGSIFTAMYPINAGMDGMSYHKIFSNSPNFLNLLQKNGYHTYATMDSGLIELGFDANFENDDQGYDRTSTNLFEGLKEKILDKFESGNLIEPWFYLIHLDDLHIPIRIPKEFQDRDYSQRYDLIVEKIDSFLGKILELVNLENTILVLTSDHGDYLLSDDVSKKNLSQGFKSKIRSKIPNPAYNYISSLKRGIEQKIKEVQTRDPLKKRILQTRTAKRRYLFDDLVHIPILFSGFGVKSIGSVADLVRSVDIFPTILDIIGMPFDSKNLDGKSLTPIFEGNKVEIPSVYLENTTFETDTKNPEPCTGIRTIQYKYFRSLTNSQDKVHLFDIQQDYLEENNIASKNPEIVKKMETELSQQRDFLKKRFDKPLMTDEETKKVEKELKKLGYV